MSEEEKQGSQVIARAAQLLRALEKQPRGLSVTELARRVALPRSTVHRLASSLSVEGLLRMDESQVRLGPALIRLAASAHTDVAALARPSIEILGRRTRETVDFCVLRASHTVSVSQYVSDQELRVVSALGTAFPIHCTAHGKALLATLSEKRVRELTGNKPERRTPNTCSNIEVLLGELRQIRQDEYAIDREEHAPGVCAVGAALQLDGHERYAFSVVVPALRFEEKFDLLCSAVMQCKAEIEALMR